MLKPCFALAFCFRDEPVALNNPPTEMPLSHRVEDRCRTANITCLVDVLNLPPARSIKGILRPVPRLQDVVTTVWPDEQRLRVVLGAQRNGDASLLGGLAQTEHVLFWVPALSIPALEDAQKRLARTGASGDCAPLGNLNRLPQPPSSPIEALDHPAANQMLRHDERLRADERHAELQYDRRVFRAVENSANGDVQPGLEFHYHEEDSQVWAFYQGPGVELGTLVAAKDVHGRLRMSYNHLAGDGRERAGHCFSYPEVLPDGRLRMHEFWRWTSGDRCAGVSLIEEREGVTIERKIS